jgi:hypothetical protein
MIRFFAVFPKAVATDGPFPKQGRVTTRPAPLLPFAFYLETRVCKGRRRYT